MASMLLRRLLVASWAGLQNFGKRDLYKVFGYKHVTIFYDYYVKYRRQDIAKRLIDMPANATWSPPPQIVPADPSTDFMKAFADFQQRYNLWSLLSRLDKLARLGEYAVLIVGTKDSSDLKTPLTGEHEISFLQPYSQGSVMPDVFDRNPLSPRFNLPTYYVVNAGGLSVLENGMQWQPAPSDPRIHWTRVLHVSFGALENEVYGTPALESVYNLLDDLIKVVGGSAETYWLAGNRGMQADVDKDMELDANDEAALSDELDEYTNDLRRVIRTRGVKLNPLGSATPDPKPSYDTILDLIAGTIGVPRRILIGSEAGRLASSEDRVQWAARISERQVLDAEPRILRPFITKMVELGALPDPGEYTVEWGEVVPLTPLERNQAIAQKARAVANLSKQFGGTQVTTLDEARRILDLLPIQQALARERLVNGSNRIATPADFTESTSSDSSGGGAGGSNVQPSASVTPLPTKGGSSGGTTSRKQGGN